MAASVDPTLQEVHPGVAIATDRRAAACQVGSRAERCCGKFCIGANLYLPR
jgi:hypothetical protein